MSCLRILSRQQASQSDMPWPDMYYSPQYARIVEISDQADWNVAVWDDGPILMPFLRRPIDGTDGCFDIASPYGYSGCWAPPEVPLEQWQAFRRALRERLVDEGTVAEFLRLGGLVPGKDALLAADNRVRGTWHNDTIVVDVGCSADEYWANCEGRARTKTRKALKLNYTTRVRPATCEDFRAGSDFRRLYATTMQRVGASGYYLFGQDYFDAFCAQLGDRLVMFEVISPTSQIVVSGFAIQWPPFLHLHLVGSEPSATRDGAGNLCYDAILRWACEHPELQRCHLGGGLSPNDPLFSFKKSFGGRRVPYWVATHILHAARYEQLVAAKAIREGCRASDLIATGYFPAYRATVPARRAA